MSYWTYTDLFEEPGPPTAPFQGGFGLLNPQGIRKPAFFAYKYLHALQGESLKTSDPQAMLATQGGNVTAVIWDFEQPDQKVSNRSFYTKLIPAHAAAPVELQVTHLVPNAAYRLEVHRTGYHANDAYSAYIEMGSPKELTAAQIAHLNELTRDLPETDKAVRSGSDGTVELSIPMNSNDIVLVKLKRTSGGQLKEKESCLLLRKFALPLILMGTLSAASVAQNAAAHPNWPGPGQLFVGACYQPIDRTPEQIDGDIAIMKHAGFNVVRMGDLSWDSFEPSQGNLHSSGSTR
jgi:hypothetical protein